MRRVVVIIPTYNESKNIVNLIHAIEKEIPNGRIIVVDDNSPDGTGKVVQQMAATQSHIHLIARKKKAGRGSAVLAGIREALKDPQTTHYIEMDADFSHDPKELPHLIQATKKADFIIASRYISQSKIINWPIVRHIFSFCAYHFAKLILQLPIRDYTNGYRCYTRRALETINDKLLQETGYALLMEMAYVAYLRKLSIVEIPTVFVNRRRGQSNTNVREIMNALNAPLRIRSRHV